MAYSNNFCIKIAQEPDTTRFDNKLSSLAPSHLFYIDFNFRYVSSSSPPLTLQAFRRPAVHARHVLLSEGGPTLLLALFANTGAPLHFVQTAIDDIIWFAWEADADPFNLERQVIKLSVEVVVQVEVEVEVVGIDDDDSNPFNFKPATKSSIQALKRVKLLGGDDDDQNRFLPIKKRRRVVVDHSTSSRKQCTICLDEFLDGEELEEVVSMPCGHVYHDVCIVKWLETSHFCPLCRYQMPS